jgi:hypothetical protein
MMMMMIMMMMMMMTMMAVLLMVLLGCRCWDDGDGSAADGVAGMMMVAVLATHRCG